MHKSVMTLAVASVFALPTLALGQAAAPAAPTLDKVLEASGISLSGYVDTAYQHADRNSNAYPHGHQYANGHGYIDADGDCDVDSNGYKYPNS